MASAKVKWFRRALDASQSAGRTFIPPAVNFAAAFIVIKASGESTWGAFVDILIFTSLCNMFISFGIRQYLLREISLHPLKAGSLIKSGFLVRLGLVIPCVVLAMILFPIADAIWIGLWLTAILVYSSIDPLVNFNRSYGAAIISELTFGAFLLMYLTLVTINQTQLVVGFALAALIRALTIVFFFRKDLRVGSVNFDLKLLLAGIPFLLLGSSGMLHSKADLYLIALLRGKEEVAVYQVTIGLFTYLQGLSAFLIIPFAKNIIRLPKKVVWKLVIRFSGFGILIVSLGIPLIFFATNYIYHFQHDLNVFLLGALYVFPSFLNVPVAYKLIGLQKEKSVLYTNFVGVFVNVVLSYYLIPTFGILGALIGSTIANWAVLVLYSAILKRTTI